MELMSLEILESPPKHDHYRVELEFNHGMEYTIFQANIPTWYSLESPVTVDPYITNHSPGFVNLMRCAGVGPGVENSYLVEKQAEGVLHLLDRHLELGAYYA